MKTKSEGKIGFIIINLAILTSILSFSLTDSISFVCKSVRYVFWVLSLLIVYRQARSKINFTAKYMVFTSVLFCSINILFCLLGLYPSFGGGIPGYIGFCALFYLVGFNFHWKTCSSIKTIIITMFISYVFLMITSLSIITNSQYLLAEKNQLGQMLGVGIILGTLVLPKITNKTIMKIIYYLIGGLLIITLMTLHSRTPLLALVVVSLVTFFTKKNRTQKDYIIAILIVNGISLIIAHLGGVDFLTELFELNEESNIGSVEGINDLISGRIDGYFRSFKDIVTSPIIGLGTYAYIDNFVICSLRTGGLLLTIFVVPFVYQKMYLEYVACKSSSNKNYMMMTLYNIIKNLTMYFFIISLMEGYPPLGPGTSVFILWMMYGILDNLEKGIEEI